MRRGFLVILLIMCSTFLLLAKQVELERAQNVAAAFLNSMDNNNLKSVHTADLVPVKIKYPSGNQLQFAISSKIDDRQLVYLFKTNDDGFVLVSGDDKAKAVLAYSLKSKLDDSDLPVNFIKWVNEYKKQLRYLRELPEYKSLAVANDWQRLENGNGETRSALKAIGPLMTTKWNQSPYYNDLCPQEYWFSEKAVTGCVATAMAQIMKFHNYPAKGSGIHSYYHTNNTVTYGNLSANFGATSYDWSNMPNQLSSGSSSTQVNAVATLMLHCGIGVNMDYSPNTSGAWVIESMSREETCAEYAFKEFFSYDKSSVRALIRDEMTYNEWIQALNNELDQGRPIMFAGVGDGGGHAFVADGYDSNNYYHMNWGWGGNSDGYYLASAFDPVDLGTGAGNGSYNWDQRVVVGIKPPTITSEADVSLYAAISVPEIYQLQAFRIDLALLNSGESAFKGELGAALFNADGDFLEFIETFTPEESLNPNYYWGKVWFETEGLSAYPGSYIIGIYYKPEGENWIAVGNGDFKNFISVEILSPFGDSDIKLYDSIFTTPSPIITSQAIRIDTKIANYSSNDYYGQLGAGLFTLDGELAQELDVITDIELKAQNIYDVWYENEFIDVEPGAYLIGLVHFPDNTDDQIVIAPNGYLNPVEVNVTTPLLGPDVFEDNDDVDRAYNVMLDFQDDFAGFTTSGTNFHSGVDEDYFRIDLAPGYNYAILGRAYDSYKSEENLEYTCDVLWAHSIESEWSDLYDDEMDEPFLVYNGGSVYFGIIPYFEGQTGTYNFSAAILREKTTGVADLLEKEDLRIFPNPASQRININGGEIIESYQIVDRIGNVQLKEKVGKLNFAVDVSSLSAGIYFIKLFGENSINTHKILIHE